MVYITPEGAYCEGKAVNGVLSCEKGLYITDAMQYRGGFINNSFEGEGFLSTPVLNFIGSFKSGKKISGKLIWHDPNTKFTY